MRESGASAISVLLKQGRNASSPCWKHIIAACFWKLYAAQRRDYWCSDIENVVHRLQKPGPFSTEAPRLPNSSRVRKGRRILGFTPREDQPPGCSSLLGRRHLSLGVAVAERPPPMLRPEPSSLQPKSFLAEGGSLRSTRARMGNGEDLDDRLNIRRSSGTWGTWPHRFQPPRPREQRPGPLSLFQKPNR
jgi:hypothetical protein